MYVTGGVFLVGALVLIVAGVPKLLTGSPVPWLPRRSARPLGAVECAVGLWAVAAPHHGGAVAAAVTYAVLTASVVVAVARHQPDCGCFGVTPVRPDALHVVTDAVFLAAALAAAVSGWTRPGGIDGVLVVVLGSTAAVLVATLLSTAADLRRLVVEVSAGRAQ